MKVYRKVVMDIESGEILHEDSFEYDGPVALCGGGAGAGYGSQDQSSQSYGASSSRSRQQASSMSRTSASSTPHEALAQLSQQLFGSATPAMTSFFSQLGEMLNTGGVNAQIPMINRAVEGTKRATSRALQETEADLAQRNLAGTPYGARTLADVRTSGALQEANIPTDFAKQFLSMIPQTLMPTAQTAIGGLTGAREDVSSGMSRSQSSGQTIMDMIQRSVSSGTGRDYQGNVGACCFIFIANMGYLHPVVRRYREDHMNLRNRRGYYWLADRLVPLMEKSRIIKKLVSIFMVNPMIAYGKYVYRFKPTGARYAPVASFWLFIFTLLGFRPPYRRRGTEEVV